MDYKIGEKVVYPNHGVGIIEQINFGVLNGRTEKYYMLRILSSGLKVMVPQSNAPAVGLRPVIRPVETGKVLGFLEKGKFNSHHDWKHRFKENSERMRTGSLIEVAAVLKSLVSLSRSKPLSFREKKMLERAKFLLAALPPQAIPPYRHRRKLQQHIHFHSAGRALSVTPAWRSVWATVAAIPGAPGVSPWMQMVCAFTATSAPPRAITIPRSTMRK